MAVEDKIYRFRDLEVGVAEYSHFVRYQYRNPNHYRPAQVPETAEYEPSENRPGDDPFLGFRQRLGEASQLSRKQEIELCQRIGQAESERRELVCRLGFAGNELIALAETTLADPAYKRFDRWFRYLRVSERENFFRELKRQVARVRVQDRKADQRFAVWHRSPAPDSRTGVAGEWLTGMLDSLEKFDRELANPDPMERRISNDVVWLLKQLNREFKRFSLQFESPIRRNPLQSLLNLWGQDLARGEAVPDLLREAQKELAALEVVVGNFAEAPERRDPLAETGTGLEEELSPESPDSIQAGGPSGGDRPRRDDIRSGIRTRIKIVRRTIKSYWKLSVNEIRRTVAEIRQSLRSGIGTETELHDNWIKLNRVLELVRTVQGDGGVPQTVLSRLGRILQDFARIKSRPELDFERADRKLQSLFPRFRCRRRVVEKLARTAENVHEELSKALDSIRRLEREPPSERREADLARNRRTVRKLEAFVRMPSERFQRVVLRLKNAAERVLQAKKAIVEANLPQVADIVGEYPDEILSFRELVPELIQAGSLGLMKACENYNHRLGRRFSDYTVRWIRLEINRFLVDEARVICASESLTGPVAQISDAGKPRSRGRPEKPLSSRLRLTARQERVVMQLVRWSISRDCFPRDGGTCVGGDIEDKVVEISRDPMSLTLLKQRIEEALASLTERQRSVLKLRYGLEDGRWWILRRIGKKFGVSRNLIHLNEHRGLNKLRHPRKLRRLEAFLEIRERRNLLG